MNQITAFIDGSMVYGSAENETRSLWTRTGPGKTRARENDSDILQIRSAIVVNSNRLREGMQSVLN